MKISMRGLAGLVAAAAIVVAGCSSGKDASSTTSTTSGVAQQGDQSPLPSNVGTQHALLQDGAGHAVVTVDLQGSLAIVQSGADLLNGRVPSQGTRVYALNGGDILKVVGSTSSFKVNDPAGDTKYSVKIGTDKTEIRQGDNTLLYTIQPKGSGQFEIDKGTTSLGTVQQAPDGVTSAVKAPDGTTVVKVTDGPFIGAYSLLLVKDIPEHERAVMIAELLARQNGG